MARKDKTKKKRKKKQKTRDKNGQWSVFIEFLYYFFDFQLKSLCGISYVTLTYSL